MTSTQRTTQSFSRRPPRRRHYLRVLMLGALFTAPACTVLEPAPLPAGAVAMHPPPEFETWWERTEQCSGLVGDYSRISWYVVPNVDTFQSEVGEVVGLWTRSKSGSEITIAGLYANSELVVRHEMLHDLLGRQGHPTYYFVEKCGLTWASWQGDTTGTVAESPSGF